MAGRIGPLANTLTLTYITSLYPIYGSQVNELEFWNTLFNLPANGEPFKAVKIISDTVAILKGGNNISLPDNITPPFTYTIKEIHDVGSITYIGSYTLSDIYDLDRVYMSAVTTAGVSAFYLSRAITNIDLPELTTTNGLLCNSCTALTTVNIPKVTSLQQADFSETSITSISLPAATIIGQSCFEACTLTSIYAPIATTIGGRAFAGCPLTSISLPAATSIGQECFLNSPSLANIYLPSCTNLGGTTGNDTVFLNISTPSTPISLTIPIALMTCNNGYPDGDIQYLQEVLQSNLTIITV
jgi:hypothetical protein